MELWERFTSEMRRVCLMAHDEAQRRQQQEISVAHLAIALLRVCPSLTAPDGEVMPIREELERLAGEGAAGVSGEPSFAAEAQRVLVRAMREAKDAGSAAIATEHFLPALFREGRHIPEALAHCVDLNPPSEPTVKPSSPLWPPPGPMSLGRFRKVFEVPGRYVNDHCLIRHEGLIHLFFIDGEVGKGCYDVGNEVIIGHATAPDMFGPWEAQAPALVHDPNLPWEERGIFAPYVLAAGSRSYMYYAGHNMAGAQVMCLATSDDLVHWERSPHNPILVPSQSWAYWSEAAATSCRDAHVLPHEDHGYIMYWVGDMKEPRSHSCVAASVSRDLVHWQEIGPVMIRHHSDLEAINCKTESPCVIRRDDLYFLFYRHGNGTKVCVSRDALDFHDRDSFFFSIAHAAEIVEFGGEWYVTSCSRPPGDVTHQEDRRHGLWVAKMAWENNWPTVV